MADSSSSSSFCSSIHEEGKYDVFISFRGEDTRYNFTSYLHAALCRSKIETFIDYQIQRGDEISPALLKAIEGSDLSIIVLSKNYATSSWCLDELLNIVDCRNTRGQIIVPVFYHVIPSDVRKQAGSYGEAFAKHEKQFRKSKNKVQKWRDALREVANLSGWNLQENDKPESEVVEEIVKDVLKKLNRISSSDSDGFIGIDERIKATQSLLCLGPTDVRIVGIWGMGGIGKTTVARAVFNRIAHQFEGCYFLANVREELAKRGVNRLQEELLFNILEEGMINRGTPNFGLTLTKKRLRRKRVFIVLDDVDNSQHLEFLAGDHGWYGPGSRIIITSRDKQVLENIVDEIYELKKLNYYEALQLFSLNAFKMNHPTEDYMELSNRVVYYAKGVPLALKVLGCFLFGRNKRNWESTLDKLKKTLNLDIQSVLRISYDGLDYEEREIFLDIACFFNGEERERVTTILDGCGLSSEIGISILIDRCLVTLECNRLLMHDLIQEMGWGIVRQDIKDPGEYSRLWDPKDISKLFKKNTGTKAIESISLDLSNINTLNITSDAFKRMNNLRLLKFYSSDYCNGYIEDNKDKVHLCQGLESISDELRYLHWHRYPLKSLPSNFNSENLVELHMHHSSVESLWDEKQDPVNLRRIDLSHSCYLTETPDLTLARNLEIMTLTGCSSLIKFPSFSWNVTKLDLSETAVEEVPTAIGSLGKLISLNLDRCTGLKNLPSSIRNLTSLEELFLYGCSNITEFPEIPNNLIYLYLNETAIEEVPSSVGCLTKLNTLRLANCKKLKCISVSISKLKSLEILDLFGCSNLDGLPEIFETMGNLQTLDLEGSSIKELPLSLERLPLLTLLSLGNCKYIATLPYSLFNLTSLSTLSLSNNYAVDQLLERSPLSLLSGFWLEELELSNCKLLELPSCLSCLSSLKHLDIDGNDFVSVSLKPFSCLETLNISYCTRLKSLLEFPSPLCLTKLQANGCISLETLPASTNLVLNVDSNTNNSFIFSNCLRLGEDAHTNILADAQLRFQIMAAKARGTMSMEEYLEWETLQGASVTICFQGSQIPEWFSSQNEGSLITMELPPDWCTSRFSGFVLCVVVAFEDYGDYGRFDIGCKCSFQNIDGGFSDDIDCYLEGFDAQPKAKIIDSDHVFMLYCHRLYAMVVQEDDGDNCFSIYQSCRKLSFHFYAVDGDQYLLLNCKVKKCGVRLLYTDEYCPSKIDDSFNEIEQAEIGSDRSSSEQDTETNSDRLEKSEPNLQAVCLGQHKVKLLSSIFLAVLALLLLGWCFSCIATANGFPQLYICEEEVYIYSRRRVKHDKLVYLVILMESFHTNREALGSAWQPS